MSEKYKVVKVMHDMSATCWRVYQVRYRTWWGRLHGKYVHTGCHIWPPIYWSVHGAQWLLFNEGGKTGRNLVILHAFAHGRW
jgi:hypothetical protein